GDVGDGHHLVVGRHEGGLAVGAEVQVVRVGAFGRVQFADELAGLRVDLVPVILQVAADDYDLAVRRDLRALAAVAVQRDRPDHLVGAHVDRAQASARGDIDEVGDGAGGHAGDLFGAHAAGVLPRGDALDELVVVVRVEHDDAGAVRPAGAFEGAGQGDVDEMASARTEAIIHATGRRGQL